jgi:hypothetical protein
MLCHRVRVKVEADHLVPAQAQPLRHVTAHLAQTNQSQLHLTSIANLFR